MPSYNFNVTNQNTLPLSGSQSGNLQNTRGILNQRPTVDFVEPDSIAGPQAVTETPTSTTPTNPVIASRLAQTEAIINQYQDLEKLADRAQIQITSRAKGLTLCMDSSLDSTTISSLHRLYGPTNNCISYDQYLECLAVISKSGHESVPQVTSTDIDKATGDVYRTSMGGFTTLSGALRPESKFKNPVQPIDKTKFQDESIKILVELILKELATNNQPVFQLYDLLFPIIRSHFQGL